jgi:hypothetical protein
LHESFSLSDLPKKRLRRDLTAVQMYGRAAFALLRARLLQPATLDSPMVHQT